MKKFFLVFLSLIVFNLNNIQAANLPNNEDSVQTETIVLIRHGEKPHGGLGQLSCQGLNRALALPNVLIGKFGKPQYIFAPNPSEKVDAAKYFYVRPLVTIEPTAIRLKLPVNTQYGYLEIEALQNELLLPKYRNSTIFMAWEHGMQNVFAKRLVKHFGVDPKVIPSWPGNEYDMIYVFKITTKGEKSTLTFKIEHEGLNNLDENCPN